MPQLIERGNPITLDAIFKDAVGDLTDPTNPKVSIITADGVTVVNLADPSAHPSVGHFQYVYAVPADAEEGAWAARWFGIIDGDELGPVDDGFTVVAQGALAPVLPPANSFVCAPWTTAAAADNCANCSGVDAGLLTQKIAVASDLLYELSGGRFSGICTDTVRPCARSLSFDGPSREVTTRSTAGGIAISAGCGCGSPRSCGCNTLHEITLGGWPLVAIIEVLIDGAVVDELSYRIDDSRYLVRLPGADGVNHGWPCCQSLDLNTTEVGTFEVTFHHGTAPPQAGIDAAGVLACELALACSGGGEACRLPHNVRSQVRQGVATEFINVLDFLREGRTGLLEVDLFLEAFGPKRKSRLGGQVVNPDIALPVRRTSAVPPS